MWSCDLCDYEGVEKDKLSDKEFQEHLKEHQVTLYDLNDLEFFGVKK